jgi:hypothetical protein
LKSGERIPRRLCRGVSEKILKKSLTDSDSPLLCGGEFQMFFGTMERPNEALLDTILNDPDSFNTFSIPAFSETFPKRWKRSKELKQFFAFKYFNNITIYAFNKFNKLIIFAFNYFILLIYGV